MSSVTFLVSALATVCLINAVDQHMTSDAYEKKALINLPSSQIEKPTTAASEFKKTSSLLAPETGRQVGYVNNINGLFENNSTKTSAKSVNSNRAI